MTKNKLKTSGEKKEREIRLVSLIKKLKSFRKSISKRGEVAPEGCNLIKYKISQNKKLYNYYKLQGYEPIFETLDGKKKTRYRYLGTAGSEAYIEGVMAVTHRRIIDEIDEMINSVEDSLLEVSFNTEIRKDPSYFTEEDKP
jgi:hypothetical protein